jgi:hypothetical protein
MRNRLVLFATVVLLISCSPRYTASFQNDDDNHYQTSIGGNQDNTSTEKLREPDFVPFTNSEPVVLPVTEVLVLNQSHPYLSEKTNYDKVASDDLKVNPRQEKEPSKKQSKKQGDDSNKKILKISIVLLVLGILVIAVGIIFLITVLANIE